MMEPSRIHNSALLGHLMNGRKVQRSDNGGHDEFYDGGSHVRDTKHQRKTFSLTPLRFVTNFYDCERYDTYLGVTVSREPGNKQKNDARNQNPKDSNLIQSVWNLH